MSGEVESGEGFGIVVGDVLEDIASGEEKTGIEFFLTHEGSGNHVIEGKDDDDGTDSQEKIGEDKSDDMKDFVPLLPVLDGEAVFWDDDIESGCDLYWFVHISKPPSSWKPAVQ